MHKSTQTAHNRFAYRILLIVVLSIAINVQSVSRISAADVEVLPPPPVSTTVKSGFDPAYAVTPIVQKLQARRGQKIPFKFEISALLDNVTAMVGPVALRQDENGAILADLNAPAPVEMQFRGIDRLELIKGQPVTIEGEIRLPNNQSPLHSFGILIRDRPREVDSSLRGESSFGLKFVTQYILRCDVQIVNARHDELHKLEIESAKFVEVDGLPLAQVFVNNPTASTLEFELDSRLIQKNTQLTGRFVHLASPIQSNLSEPERWTAKILPHSRIRLEAAWPTAVFAGEYELESRIMRKRRNYRTERSTMQVLVKEFRAQETHVVAVAPGIHVNPAQVSLGHSRPHKRFTSVAIRNMNTVAATINVELIDSTDGKELDWAIVRPAQFRISAGGSRKLVLSLDRMEDRESHKLGYLTLKAVDQQGKLLGQQKLPLAFFGSDNAEAKLVTGEAQFIVRRDPDNQSSVQRTFVLPVSNQSTVPHALSAQLTTRDISNNPVMILAGFGKWLLPHETVELEFPLGELDLPPESFRGRIDLLDTDSNPIFGQNFELKLQ